MQLHFYFWHSMGADNHVAKLCLKFAIRGCIMPNRELVRQSLIVESLEKEHPDDRY